MSNPSAPSHLRSNPIGGLARGIGLLITGAGLVLRRARLFGLGLIPPLITGLVFIGLFVSASWVSQRVAVWVTPFADGWAGAEALRGLVALLVVVVFYKVRSFRTLAGFFTDSIGRTSIVVVIVIGASLLSAVIIRSGAPQELARKVVESGFEAWQFLLVLNVILLVMGMFLEGVAIILIVVPVVAPVITQIGIAPEHFAVVMVINIELALLSPPIGLNLFVLSNVTGRPVSEVLRGTLPFFLLMLGLLLLITFVPEISTWLPSAVMDAN